MPLRHVAGLGDAFADRDLVLRHDVLAVGLAPARLGRAPSKCNCVRYREDASARRGGESGEEVSPCREESNNHGVRAKSSKKKAPSSELCSQTTGRRTDDP